MSKNKCKHCGKETTNPLYCSRKCSNLENRKGKGSWCKGKTKETDKRVALMGQKISKYRKENNWVAWNKGLTKNNSEKIVAASKNMSEAKQNPKYKEIAVKNLKKATEANCKKYREAKPQREKEKLELKSISKEIEKLKKIEKVLTILSKVRDEKNVFNSFTIEEKILYYLYKNDCKQTKNNLHQDRDWFFNETKKIVYKKTNFINDSTEVININGRIKLLECKITEFRFCKICGKQLPFNNRYSSYLDKMFCSSGSCKNIGRFIKILIDKIGDYLEPQFNIINWSGRKEVHKWKCLKCETIFSSDWVGTRIPRCPTCYPTRCNRGVSSIEIEIATWVSQYVDNVKRNFKLFEKRNDNPHYFREVDIYLPDYNFGIELDGIYWHSELNGKHKNYHIDKTKLFKKNNIEIIHIWDDEWTQNKKIVQSIILNKIHQSNTKIFARKCEIQELTKIESRDFLEVNHIQGSAIDKIRIGLFYESNLVQVLTLLKSRFNKTYEWEIIRSATLLNSRVIGGFSKLLSFFIKKYTPNSIITYSDLRFGTGNVYKVNGFTLKETSQPNYFYTKDYIQLESRMKYQKHKLKTTLDNYDDQLSEWNNMQLNGYDRVWDCGNNVYVFDNITY